MELNPECHFTLYIIGKNTPPIPLNFDRIKRVIFKNIFTYLILGVVNPWKFFIR